MNENTFKVIWTGMYKRDGRKLYQLEFLGTNIKRTLTDSEGDFFEKLIEDLKK